MGQQMARRSSWASPSLTTTETALSSDLSALDQLDALDISQQAEELGIHVHEDDDPKVVQRLVNAHMGGLARGREETRRIAKTRLTNRSTRASTSSVVTRSPSVVLRTLRTMPGKMGCDIGGTCAKLVLMVSESENEEMHGQLPDTFGTTGKIVSDLEETIVLPSGAYVLKFISGETSYLEALIRNLADRPAFQDLPAREITVAGGGALKYAKLFKEALNFEFIRCPEMLSVIEGLRFILQHREAFPNEVFKLNDNLEKEYVNGSLQVDRFLIVNMGSGVSVLDVTKNSFRRVGGTACGGATFLGLSRLMCGTTTFEEALKMAEEGDGEGIDTLVSDIYGKEGCSALGLPPSRTASNFGKMGTEIMSGWKMPRKSDITHSILKMVIQGTCVLATAFSSTMGISSVFFTGGFLRNNRIAIELLAQSMQNLGAQAYFCKHCDFLGALGSLKICLQEELNGSDDETSDSSDIGILAKL
eukprot:GEMP01025699.1.p1 GENE.GEMP01025699.1~~GEMP01025699.1.p1  ORF type:complete len:475 (+),score=63.65 GEMP01025699.1:224-1648(+)